MAVQQHSTGWLVARSFLPSAMSGLLCFCFSILIIGVHLLLLSVNIGTSLPKVFDGQWAIAYTNNVVQPLTALFSNLVFNDLVVMLLWGLAGLATYFLFEYVSYVYKRWRHTQHDIQLAGEQVIRHPGRKNFATVVLWRVSVLVIATGIFLAAQPLIARVLAADPKLVIGDFSLAVSLRKLTFALIGWTLLAHAFVVFLRLFLMRTRLYGDPAIE